MTGLWVGLSKAKTRAEVLSTFAGWFPELSCGLLAEALKPGNEWPSIVFEIVTNKSEFPSVIDYSFPGDQDETLIMPVIIEIARQFSEEYQCRTICDGSGYGDHENYPGDAIIWDGGRSYLADDYGSEFGGDETGERVQLVRELELDNSENQRILKQVVQEEENKYKRNRANHSMLTPPRAPRVPEQHES